jgi:hypothetical protein
MAKTRNKSNAKWTVMIYMAADDEPSYNASIDFRKELFAIGEELDKLGAQSKVNILLQVYLDWDTTGSNPDFRAKRFKIKTAFESEKPETTLNPKVSMGNSNTLTRFINWCKKKYPAEKYLLLLWGHGTGSGLFSADLQATYNELKQKRPDLSMVEVNSGQKVTLTELLRHDSPFFNNPDNRSKEITIRLAFTDENNQEFSDILTATQEKSTFFRNNPKFFLRFNNPSTINKLRSDLTAKSNLDGLIGKELDKSLAKSFGDRSKIDLVVVMGCCMQMVEFGYEIRKHCRHYVASEELIFFEGYNYFDTFSSLLKSPKWSARNLAENFIIKTPKKDDYTKEEKGFLAISAVDLEKSNRLFSEINTISKELTNNFEELKELVRKARLKCSHFGEQSYRSSFIDIIWFLESLRKILRTKKLHPRLCNKIDSLKSFLEEKYIIKSFIGEKKEPKRRQERTMGGYGVGIYFPSSLQDHIDDEERGKYFNRKETAFVNTFSKNNNWNKLIFQYMKTTPGEKTDAVIQDDDGGLITAMLAENYSLKNRIIPDLLLRKDRLKTGSVDYIQTVSSDAVES